MGRKQHLDVDIFNYDGMFDSLLFDKIKSSCVSAFLVFCLLRSNTAAHCCPVAQCHSQGAVEAGLPATKDGAAAKEEGLPGLHQDPAANGSFCWNQGRETSHNLGFPPSCSRTQRFLNYVVSAGPEKWAD